MTHPAEVTHRLDWADLISALSMQTQDIDSLVEYIAAQRDTEESGPEADQFDRDVAEDLDRHLRDDYEADFDLDGDYDPDPGLESL